MSRFFFAETLGEGAAKAVQEVHGHGDGLPGSIADLVGVGALIVGGQRAAVLYAKSRRCVGGDRTDPRADLVQQSQ